jgi:hypothetical protein
MGPIALFDKSFLQAISVDEAVWFDRFFSAVVCPVFFTETLADLAKEQTKRGPAEVIVSELASRSPEMNGIVCGFHIDLAVSNLLGMDIPLDGRVPRPGSRVVMGGTVYEEAPEDLAFQRWEQGNYYEVERSFASFWRARLLELDLSVIARELRKLGVDGKRCRALEDARDIARKIVTDPQMPMARFALCFSVFNVPTRFHRQIVRRWEDTGRMPLDKFAPYAAYVLTIEVFFQIALAAGLISTERVSNRTDIAYLFYLPFSMVFISQDRLHRRCAPLFMRQNQQFVWGIDLKAALQSINDHFLQLPEAERDRGILSFASAPPPGNIVADLWDTHLVPGYRSEPDVKLTREAEVALLKRLTAFTEQSTLEVNDAAAPKGDDMISIKRMWHKRRGSWWQLPKDFQDVQSKTPNT